MLRENSFKRNSPQKLRKSVTKEAQSSRHIKGQFNQIIHPEAELSNVSFHIEGQYNSIVIGAGARLQNVKFFVYGDFHRIEIGQNVVFNGASEIWAEDSHGFIKIGRDSTFEGVHLSCTEPETRLLIGEDCMFSYAIDIRTGDSHSLLNSAGIRLNYAQNIHIGDHVWVASHCVFTKGARVSSGSVVANSSLINKPFKQERVVLAGSPAKIVNKDILWCRERIYQSVDSGVTHWLQTESA